MFRILVVDDETDIADLFKQHFRREIRRKTYELVFAHSGREAVSLFEKDGSCGFHAVLCDINMPEMTGWEVLSRAKAFCAELPVLMVSAYSDEGTRGKAAEGGASGLCPKPVDFADLKSRLEKELGALA